MGKVIELKDVTKEYKSGSGKVAAIKDINLELLQGESMAIVGPSGSGKSTLLNMIGVLDKPTRGEIIINGEHVKKLRDNQLSNFRNKTIGFIFQFFNLQEYLSAKENIMVPMLFSGIKHKHASEKAEELLKKVGLENRKNNFPKQLSGGEMQRVAIARSLANDPKILLADEPTANLDKASAENVLNIFDEIASSGVSIIVITHDHNVSSRYKNVFNLKNGEAV